MTIDALLSELNDAITRDDQDEMYQLACDAARIATTSRCEPEQLAQLVLAAVQGYVLSDHADAAVEAADAALRRGASDESPTARGTARFAMAWALSTTDHRGAIQHARDGARELARGRNPNAWNVRRWAADHAFEHELLDEALDDYSEVVSELRKSEYAEHADWANDLLSHSSTRLGVTYQRVGRVPEAAKWLTTGAVTTVQHVPIGDPRRAQRLELIAQAWRAIGDENLARSVEELIDEDD